MNLDSKDNNGSTNNKRKSYYVRIIKRFFNHKLGLSGFVFLCILILVSLLAAFIAPYDPTEINTQLIRTAPSGAHLFGTDELGRDILSRIIYGTRVTMMVMVISISLAIFAGTIIGLVSGYAGGAVDAVIMRIMDSLLAFPALILALAIISVLGPGIFKAMLAISIVNIPSFARVVRGQVLSTKEREYVKAAKSLGCSSKYVLFKEVAPNSLDAVMIILLSS